MAEPTAKALGWQRPSVQGLCTVIDQALVSLTSFMTMVLVGQLGQEELGVYVLGVSTFWLAVGIPKALLWTPYTVRAARLEHPARQSYLTNVSWMMVFIALLGAGLLLVLGVVAPLLTSQQTWLQPFFFSLAPLAFMLTLREHIRRVAIADFRSPQLILFDLPVCAAIVTAITLLSVWGYLSANGAFLATGAAAALAIPFVWRQLVRSTDNSRAFLADVSSHWQFGRWLLLAAVAALLGDGALRWMLLGMHGKEAVGVFGAAFAVVALVNPLLLAMNSFARSWATRVHERTSYSGLLQHTLRATAVVVVLAVVAALAFSMLGNFAVASFFPAGFSEPLLVTLLAAGVCLQATLIPAEATLTTLEKGKQLSFAAGLRLATTFVVGIPLVYQWGAIGIGWAMVARSVPVAIVYAFALVQEAASHRLNISGSPAAV